MNPAEYVLDLINTDFDSNGEILDDLVSKWKENEHDHSEILKLESDPIELTTFSTTSEIRNIGTLISRSLVKASRDILTYYVRLVMYLGLAILMGTVWLRLGKDQKISSHSSMQSSFLVLLCHSCLLLISLPILKTIAVTKRKD